MSDNPIDRLLATLVSPTQGKLVDTYGRGADTLFEEAVRMKPDEFRRVFNKRVDSLGGFSAQRAPKTEPDVKK